MISSSHLLPDIGVESSVHWAFIRSRRKLIEEGEQNSAYFLEREQAKNNHKKKLMVDGNITDDSRNIAKLCAKFYSDLYTSKLCPKHMNDFFSDVI